MGLGTGKSPDHTKQTPTGRQCTKELADIRTGQQGVGATVGVADGVAAIEQAENLLLRGQSSRLSFFLKVLQDGRLDRGPQTWRYLLGPRHLVVATPLGIVVAHISG